MPSYLSMKFICPRKDTTYKINNHIFRSARIRVVPPMNALVTL